MVDATGAEAERFFIFCRFWPGFTEAFPYDEFNGLPDELLRTDFNAKAALRMPSHQELAAREEEARRARLSAAARMSVRRRPCGNSAVRAKPSLPTSTAKVTKPASKKKTAKKANEAECKRIAEEMLDSIMRRPWNAPVIPRPVAAAPSSPLANLSPDERRVVECGCAVGWHDGTGLDPDLRSMFEGWGHELWSRRIWLAAIEGEELVQAATKNAQEACRTLECMTRGGWPGLSRKHANARLCYLSVDRIDRGDRAAFRQEIEQMRRLAEPRPLEDLVQRLQELVDEYCHAWVAVNVDSTTRPNGIADRSNPPEFLTGEVEPALPQIDLRINDAEIAFDGKIFAGVHRSAAEALKAICDGHPRPVGLTRIVGPHPNRLIAKLPDEIRSRTRPTPQGYVFDL